MITLNYNVDIFFPESILDFVKIVKFHYPIPDSESSIEISSTIAETIQEDPIGHFTIYKEPHEEVISQIDDLKITKRIILTMESEHYHAEFDDRGSLTNLISKKTNKGEN